MRAQFCERHARFYTAPGCTFCQAPDLPRQPTDQYAVLRAVFSKEGPIQRGASNAQPVRTPRMFGEIRVGDTVRYLQYQEYDGVVVSIGRRKNQGEDNTIWWVPHLKQERSPAELDGAMYTTRQERLKVIKEA